MILLVIVMTISEVVVIEIMIMIIIEEAALGRPLALPGGLVRDAPSNTNDNKQIIIVTMIIVITIINKQ